MFIVLVLSARVLGQKCTFVVPFYQDRGSRREAYIKKYDRIKQFKRESPVLRSRADVPKRKHILRTSRDTF